LGMTVGTGAAARVAAAAEKGSAMGVGLACEIGSTGCVTIGA
jgi:hypothetical protein